MNNFDAETKVWICWMRRALHLAELGEGKTCPNPLVGAVILDSEGNLVGEGFHERAGMAHAEVGALQQAGSKANGGTLVVSLEPCCHWGKTPPCTESILKAGISKVVIAMEDPDHRVSGSGVKRLKEAGIKVLTGVLQEEASYQNRAFIFRVQTGRSWGILKWAMSLDGRISLPNGKSKWITSQESRHCVHKLRAKCDAVIVGGETVRSDNPLLTSRGLSNPEPIRVIFSKSLDLPRSSQLWDTKVSRTIIASSIKSFARKNLEELPNKPEHLSLQSSNPINLLTALANKGLNKVLWECGPSLATEAISTGCVQELSVFIAPKILGGASAKTPLAELGFDSMDEVLSFGNRVTKKIGEDLLINVDLTELKA